jgi:amino acid permease
VLILGINLLPVRVYGETEFVFGAIKTLTIVGMIFAGLLVDWGASPSGEYIGGKNWSPYVSSPLAQFSRLLRWHLPVESQSD